FGHSGYHKNHFISWVLENKETIMTARQLEVFDFLLENYVALTDRTPELMAQRNEIFKQVNLTSNTANKMFKAIKEKCTKKYETEFSNIYYSHVTAGRMSLNDVLNSYVASADDKKREIAEERQVELNAIIQENYNDNEAFELI